MYARLISAVVSVSLVVAVSGAPAAAAPSEKQEARKLYDKATAAFGLGRYGEAAESYEGAFRLRPDPALLFNAAQSYRLAGNRDRAIELYRNYLRLYGEVQNADDARKHIRDLELQIAAERAVPSGAARAPDNGALTQTPPTSPSTSPPNGANVPSGTAPVQPLTAPPPATAPGATAVPTLVVAPNPAEPPSGATPVAGADDQRPLTRQPLFWAAVGAAVVAAVVIAIVATRGDRDPKPSIGVVVGN